MYKIYCDNKIISFQNDVKNIEMNPKALILENAKPSDVIRVGKIIKNNELYDEIYLTSENIDNIFDIFKSEFQWIEAAGGLVLNPENKMLFIHRLGKWDLPKGKIEVDESVDSAAIREVEEECGMKNLMITKNLAPTFHIYPFKNNFVLKKTHWFEMKSDYKGELIPQLEEDITEVKWMDKTAVKQALNDTYPTISEMEYWKSFFYTN